MLASPHADLRDAWASLVAVLKTYGDLATYLNGPCSPEALHDAEIALGFPMPELLAELLKLNNGQRIEEDGKPIFKSPSGASLYRWQSSWTPRGSPRPTGPSSRASSWWGVWGS